MGSPPDPSRPDGVDWLEIGPKSGPTGPSARLRRQLLVVAACLGLAILSGVAVTARDGSLPPAEEPAPTPASASSRLPEPKPETRQTFTDPSLAVPGERSVLFARTEGSLYRIDLSNGRVSRTDGVAVTMGGPVSLIVGPRQVIVGLNETGGGMLVPDGRMARPLPPAFSSAHQLYPGPPGLLWSRSVVGQARARIALVDYSGKLQKRAYLLRGSRPQTDGAGGLLLSDVGGVYEADQTDIRRLTTGTVTAVGPHHYLLVSCNSQRRCSSYVHDRSRGTERRLAAADTTVLPSGTISPDGRHAALILWRRPGPPVLNVADLTDGSILTLPGQPDLSSIGTAPSLLWTPNGRRLIALLDGQIHVHDTETGRSRRVGDTLPQLLQLALRPVS